jgi:hypothetical protein
VVGKRFAPWNGSSILMIDVFRFNVHAVQSIWTSPDQDDRKRSSQLAEISPCRLIDHLGRRTAAPDPRQKVLAADQPALGRVLGLSRAASARTITSHESFTKWMLDKTVRSVEPAMTL